MNLITSPVSVPSHPQVDFLLKLALTCVSLLQVWQYAIFVWWTALLFFVLDCNGLPIARICVLLLNELLRACCFGWFFPVQASRSVEFIRQVFCCLERRIDRASAISASISVHTLTRRLALQLLHLEHRVVFEPLHPLLVDQVLPGVSLIFVVSAQDKHEVELEGEVNQRGRDYRCNRDHPYVVHALVHSFEHESFVTRRIFGELFADFLDHVIQDEVYHGECDELDEVEDKNERVGEPETSAHLLIEALRKCQHKEEEQEALQEQIDPVLH